ncbi:MAG TPA: YraN family protein [Thermoanaerobaculia bacterium]|nr:YraN family protein [Thermoanaerobaculia bacterium]
MSHLESKELGRRGERRAAWFYRLRGYSIVARNLRFPEGELDLIVRKGRTIVIAEVKARQSDAKGAPHEAVDATKQHRLVRLAESFLRRFPDRRSDLVVRFDVLSLLWSGRRFHLTHYEDAFRPMRQPGRPWQWKR